MKPLLVTVAWINAVLFAGVTLYCVTVRGIFEPARMEVDHFEAGAGDLWLLLRGALALMTTITFLALACQPGSRPLRLALGIGAICALPLFIWSCVGLERWAPGYSESTYMALSDRFYHGKPPTNEEILAALGPPLFTGHHPSGTMAWSYSYMPSCGFGWHKRLFLLREGQVAMPNSIDEP